MSSKQMEALQEIHKVTLQGNSALRAGQLRLQKDITALKQQVAELTALLNAAQHITDNSTPRPTEEDCANYIIKTSSYSSSSKAIFFISSEARAEIAKALLQLPPQLTVTVPYDEVKNEN